MLILRGCLQGAGMIQEQLCHCKGHSGDDPESHHPGAPCSLGQLPRDRSPLGLSESPPQAVVCSFMCCCGVALKDLVWVSVLSDMWPLISFVVDQHPPFKGNVSDQNKCHPRGPDSVVMPSGSALPSKPLCYPEYNFDSVLSG